jgi:ribosomal protein S18 acetylase RimI-like enzyme
MKSTRNQILALDRDAFGSEWTMDTQTFAEALSATRRAAVFVCHVNDELVGFVIVGATGTTGFIQRLAVVPTARRSGVASALLASALTWTNRHGCTSSIVNTEIHNSAALRTYEKFGFEPLDNGLSVLEMTLTS